MGSTYTAAGFSVERFRPMSDTRKLGVAGTRRLINPGAWSSAKTGCVEADLSTSASLVEIQRRHQIQFLQGRCAHHGNSQLGTNKDLQCLTSVLPLSRWRLFFAGPESSLRGKPKTAAYHLL